MKRVGLLCGCLGLIVGCGSEVGRLPFAAEGTEERTVKLSGGELRFWTDIDMTYEGDAALAYEVELHQGGARVAVTRCDPLARLSVRVSWVETNLSGRHSRRGSGRMSCTAQLPQGGDTVVRATLGFTQRPTTMTLNRADLVIRQ